MYSKAQVNCDIIFLYVQHIRIRLSGKKVKVLNNFLLRLSNKILLY